MNGKGVMRNLFLFQLWDQRTPRRDDDHPFSPCFKRPGEVERPPFDSPELKGRKELKNFHERRPASRSRMR